MRFPSFSRLTKLCLCTAVFSALLISLLSNLTDHWMSAVEYYGNAMVAEDHNCATCGDRTLDELYRKRETLRNALQKILQNYEEISEITEEPSKRKEGKELLLDRLIALKNSSLDDDLPEADQKEPSQKSENVRVVFGNSSGDGDDGGVKKIITERSIKRTIRNNVIIVAYKRSGSSFVGQLFNQNPKVFYLYEPLFSLRDLEKSSREFSRAMIDHLLDVILHCKFKEHRYFVGFTSTDGFRMNSEVLSSPELCKSRSENHTEFLDSCMSLDPASLEDMCSSRDHSVAKTIRLNDLSFLEPFMKFNVEEPTSVLKILHLVRDPRAILSSRSLTVEFENPKHWTLKDFRNGAKKLCSKMLSMLRYGTHKKDWEPRYHVIRYEDIAREPMKATDELYDFIGLEQSLEVYDWLKKNTVASEKTEYFSTKKNSTASISAWRLRTSFSHVQIVQSECTEVMLLLGYRMVANEMELRNIRQSLIVPRLPGQSVFITNCLKELISEFDYLRFENEILAN